MVLFVCALMLTAAAVLFHVLVNSGSRAEARTSRRQDEARQWEDAVAAVHVDSLYEAATCSDADLRRRLEAVSVNVQNPDGDSALHLAYYADQQVAVARLKAFGADDTLRNRDGLTPTEMVDVRETEELLKQTLACMTRCMWIDEARGLPLYQALKQRPSRIYNPALVRVFLRDKHPRRLVCLAVKVGMPGSERQLALMLEGYGTKELAEVYLNSGSEELAAAGRRWAAARGYPIVHRSFGESARWGQF